MLIHYVTAEARTLIDAEDTGDAANHAADSAANDGSDRSGRAFTLSGAALDTARHALSRRHRWKEGARGNHGQCN